MVFVLKFKIFVNHAGPSTTFGSLPTVKIREFWSLNAQFGD